MHSSVQKSNRCLIMGPAAQPKSFKKDVCPFSVTPVCKNCDSLHGRAENENSGITEELTDGVNRGDDASRPFSLSLPVQRKMSENLTELRLSGQGLKAFPDREDLSGLLVLDLSHNEIPELPLGLKSSTHLRVLDLSHNCLNEFPSVLQVGLAVLKNVNLSFNTLKTLPRPACVQHLNELTAQSCQLTEFPKWILFERHCVETLDLSMNPVFEHFPIDERLAYHSCVKMLKKINLSNTFVFDRLRTLFSQLTSVEYLDVSNYGMKYCNRLMSCDELLAPNLRVLKAVDLCLASNPSLEGCTKLETLNLAKNPMSWINSDFPCESLRFVVLPNCFICLLPDNFGDMVNLEYLNLCHNDLGSLPSSFVKLTRLKHLDLYRNSLITLPEQLEYLKQITCLDLCQNYFQPPSHPLGDGLPSYEEMKVALRATVTESRRSGMVPKQAEQLYLSDDGSGEYRKYGSNSSGSSVLGDTDDENCDNSKPVFIRPLPVDQLPEEDWNPHFDVGYQGDSHFSDQGLQQELTQEFRASCDLNAHFVQYLQLVPERIRNSPFYYHRIDTSSNLSPVRRFSRADVAEGQFDD